MGWRENGLGGAMALLVAGWAGGGLAAEIVGLRDPLPAETGEPASLILKAGPEDDGTPMSRSDIEKLPLYESEMDAPWGIKGRFVGAKLLDVLAARGLGGAKAYRIEATDHYACVVTREELAANTALLATRFNGQPIATARKGPFRLLWPALAEKVVGGKAPSGNWIWSISTIQKVASQKVD